MEAIRMRGVLSLLALILVFGLLAEGCTPKKAKEKAPIKIAINSWAGHAHAYIAKEKGYFEKNGARVELVFDKNYTPCRQRYIDGKVDGIFGVYSDAILLSSEGISSRVVYVGDYCVSADVIVGKPEFKDLSGLKGKKVGIESVNTFSHLFVLAALEKSGVKEQEVRFEIVPAQEILKALEEGRIDAGHTWEPAKAAATGDTAGLSKAAHSLRGACASIGVMGMVEICKTLESLGQGKYVDGAMALVEKLETEFNQVKVEIEREIALSPPPSPLGGEEKGEGYSVRDRDIEENDQK